MLVSSPEAGIELFPGYPHVLSADQFKRPYILEKFFPLTERMIEIAENYRLRQRDERNYTLRDTAIKIIMGEPSTRTKDSFDAAARALGAEPYLETDPLRFSSMFKGESIPDSTRVYNSNLWHGYVIRWPTRGGVAEFAEVSTVPVFNAGDGDGEHPTQSLLDLFTIKHEKGSVDGLKVAMVGDLKKGRTVHSLFKSLGEVGLGNEVFGVSPPFLPLPPDLENNYKDRVKFTPVGNLDEILSEVDVVYMTRIQRERISIEEDGIDPGALDFNALVEKYAITKDRIRQMKKDSILMHPLPRVSKNGVENGVCEIDPEVDEDPRAVYFKQVQNGLYVRMALYCETLASEGIARFY